MTERDGTRRRDAALCSIAMLTMLAFAALHVIAPDLPWIRRLELLTLDARIRLRGPLQPGPETVLVLIDDDSVGKLGRWPLPRRRFAEAVDFLATAGARVIGIDVLFTEPEAPDGGGDAGDRALAAAIRRAGTVVLPFAFRFDRGSTGDVPDFIARTAFAETRSSVLYAPTPLRPSGVLAPLPPLGEAAAALGHVTIAYDLDGAPRYEYPVLAYGFDNYPSMALRIVQLYRRLPWGEVEAELGRGVQLGDHLIATDPSMRLLVNYLGPAGQFPTYSFAGIVSGVVPATVFRNRIVLIGTRITGISDAARTPFSAVLPGVERLASVVDSILQERPLYRPVYAPWLEASWMIAFALAVAFAVSRVSVARAALLAAALLVLWLVLGQLALVRLGIWTAVAMPSLSCLLVFTTLAAYRYGLLDREYRRTRQAFKRYLAPDIVEQLARSRQPPQLGGEQREITVMFCDLRGFSGIAGQLEPRELTRVLNMFLSTVTEAVLARGGTVDKYMGDAVMAFWNAPLDQPAHAALACRAALAVVGKVEKLNEQAGLGGIRLDCAIGINTGLCTVGNFGSRHRFDYSAVGDAVNIAARLENESKGLGLRILLGPSTAERVSALATLPIGPIRLRGRDQSLAPSVLLGDEALRQRAEFPALAAQHEALSAALAAGDRQHAQSLVAALSASAPPELATYYSRIVGRREP